ncbi:hypothetical protein FisN_3Hh255 [Fistulifera solaris]|uniref:Uncharacterized protein n=1 Tax=Fistulifera solaris TaxID=1519565 RepID=A0A1Z5JQG2_FISSO|nr:hypothetical protein FisN_3Hh255 [Fistulifera solaris]|eukprot:GAX16263.1 hypothetical protein FisN_3Hh255 [Fistulifera solaris]
MDRQGLSPSLPTNYGQPPLPGFMPPNPGYHFPHPPFMPNPFPSIRIEVKLVNSKTYPECNTDLSVITIVKKPSDMDFKSVAEFGRSLLTDCAPDWILKLARRHASMRKRTKSSVFLCFGGGYDLLVLLEGAKVPSDISKVPRISVSTAIATKSEENRLGKENLPIAGYSDGVWDHVNAVASTFRGPPAAADLVAVLSDSVAPYGAIEGISDRVKVIRIWTHAERVDEATRFDHTQDLDLSKMIVSKSFDSTPPSTQLVAVEKPSTTQTKTSTAKATAASEMAKKSSVSSLTKKTPTSSSTKTSTTPKPAPILTAEKTLAPSPTKVPTTAKPAPSAAAMSDVSKENVLDEPAKPADKVKAAGEPKKRGRPVGSKNSTKTSTQTEGEANPPSKKVKTTTKAVTAKKVDEEKNKEAAPKKAVAKKSESASAEVEQTKAAAETPAEKAPINVIPGKNKEAAPKKTVAKKTAATSASSESAENSKVETPAGESPKKKVVKKNAESASAESADGAKQSKAKASEKAAPKTTARKSASTTTKSADKSKAISEAPTSESPNKSRPKKSKEVTPKKAAEKITEAAASSESVNGAKQSKTTSVIPGESPKKSAETSPKKVAAKKSRAKAETSADESPKKKSRPNQTEATSGSAEAAQKE